MKKWMMIWLLIGVFVFSFIEVVSGATYYIDPSCSNNGDGLGENCAASPGGVGAKNTWSVSWVAGNTYAQKRGTTFTGMVIVGANGTEVSRITLDAYGNGENPIVDANGTNGASIYLSLKEYISVRNYQVRNATSRNIWVSAGSNNSFENIISQGGSVGIYLDKSDDAKLDNVSIYDSQSYGIQLRGDSSTKINRLNLTNVLVNNSNNEGILIDYYSDNIYMNGITSNYNLYNGLTITNGYESMIIATDWTLLENNNSGLLVHTNNISLRLNGGTSSGNQEKGIRFQSVNFLNQSFVRDFTINNNSGTGITLLTSNNISLENVTINNSGTNGISFLGSSSYLNLSNCRIINNADDGISVSGDVTNLLVERCSVGWNGNNSALDSGDGFTAHTNSLNLTVRNSLFYNNKNTGLAVIQNSSGVFENNVVINNGLTNFPRAGIYTRLTGGDGWIIQNNIIQNNYPREIDVDSLDITLNTLNYNNYYHPLDNTFATIDGRSSNINWSTYLTGSGQDSNSKYSNASLINEGNNFSLQQFSSAIDSGTDVGLTTDYLGNPIYGTPDIGAYEYQPPYNISEDAINLSVSKNIRIYGDGKYRYINSTTSTENVNLSVVPVAGFNSTNYSQWMDINVTTWTTSLMNWTEDSDTIGSSSVTQTICGLTAGDQYDTYYTKSGTRTLISRYTVDSSGCVIFNYTEGYSSVIFDMAKYVTPVTEEDTSPQGGGGTPTYYPTKSDLQEGYLKQLYTNWKLSFKHNEESHQLRLDSFDKVNRTATITISSEPQTKTLSVGEEWKVNLNNNTYYDLLVRLNNVTSTRANVFIQEINEEIEVDVIEEGEPGTQKEAIKDKDCIGGINCWYYVSGGIVLALILLVVAFFIGKKYLKKKK